jgi:hypothetical protein
MSHRHQVFSVTHVGRSIYEELAYITADQLLLDSVVAL